MPVVTDVHADACEGRIKTRITKVTRTKVKLFPEAGVHVRYVVLTILAEILAVRIDHCSSVVIDASDLFFVDRHDDYHAMLFRYFLHETNSRAVRNTFDSFVPARLLFGAEVRCREDLLHADNLNTLLSCLFDKTKMLFDVQPFDFFNRCVSRSSISALYQSAFNCAWHLMILLNGSELTKMFMIGRLTRCL